ncbi:uncharacterized protein LOC135925472 isoform X2 [Gordionus sp. m RMFG-2023]|uniref:uncharacterized protein LOC135925472 isoform X2 n=1 Tax=Gordionus sp. m RMFG-2023 TaxID=3053472 RepID=UPI0031FC41EA
MNWMNRYKQKYNSKEDKNIQKKFFAQKRSYDNKLTVNNLNTIGSDLKALCYANRISGKIISNSNTIKYVNIENENSNNKPKFNVYKHIHKPLATLNEEKEDPFDIEDEKIKELKDSKMRTTHLHHSNSEYIKHKTKNRENMGLCDNNLAECKSKIKSRYFETCLSEPSTSSTDKKINDGLKDTYLLRKPISNLFNARVGDKECRDNDFEADLNEGWTYKPHRKDEIGSRDIDCDVNENAECNKKSLLLPYRSKRNGRAMQQDNMRERRVTCPKANFTFFNSRDYEGSNEHRNDLNFEKSDISGTADSPNRYNGDEDLPKMGRNYDEFEREGFDKSKRFQWSKYAHPFATYDSGSGNNEENFKFAKIAIEKSHGITTNTKITPKGTIYKTEKAFVNAKLEAFPVYDTEDYSFTDPDHIFQRKGFERNDRKPEERHDNSYEEWKNLRKKGGWDDGMDENGNKRNFEHDVGKNCGLITHRFNDVIQERRKMDPFLGNDNMMTNMEDQSVARDKLHEGLNQIKEHSGMNNKNYHDNELAPNNYRVINGKLWDTKSLMLERLIYD